VLQLHRIKVALLHTHNLQLLIILIISLTATFFGADAIYRGVLALVLSPSLSK